jgi:hypothetical protein
MKHFIKALYADLLHRIDVVVEDINKLNPHENIRERFIDKTLEEFAEIRLVLKSAFETGVLEFDAFAGNNLHKFNTVHRQFKAIHSYRYLALKNYGPPEIFFFRLISQIYQEHRISAIPPIVSTISNHDDYYWAVPYYEIIALPSGEENSLLNLPDIYHEIGHLLHSMFNRKSCELSTISIDKYFAKEIVRVEEEGLASHYKNSLETAKYLWHSSWIEEFACDLVGTYMTGPAYGWTNLKLLSTGHGSTKIYAYSGSHPANEARMRIIILMLEKMGMNKEKAEIEFAWKLFLKDTEGYKPNEYSLLYPQHLLKLIVDELFNFYQNADLTSYPDLLKSGVTSIAGLLNEAWTNAQTNPSNYYAYEEKVIKTLKENYSL